MNFRFVTSISRSYWNSIGKYCIPTWNLPGEVIILIDQSEGDLNWIEEIPFSKCLIKVPELKINDRLNKKFKVRKFWGKSYAQIYAVLNRPVNTQIIWLDSDIEQIKKYDTNIFDFNFTEPLALCKSNQYSEDCFETGVVIFNSKFKKINFIMNEYYKFWFNEEKITSLFRPYDAHVLGEIGNIHGFYNLCENECENIDALKNTRFKDYIKHWINKDNKKLVIEKYSNFDENK